MKVCDNRWDQWFIHLQIGLLSAVVSTCHTVHIHVVKDNETLFFAYGEKITIISRKHTIAIIFASLLHYVVITCISYHTLRIGI